MTPRGERSKLVTRELYEVRKWHLIISSYLSFWCPLPAAKLHTQVGREHLFVLRPL